jgi:hypothetical protein
MVGGFRQIFFQSEGHLPVCHPPIIGCKVDACHFNYIGNSVSTVMSIHRQFMTARIIAPSNA